MARKNILEMEPLQNYQGNRLFTGRGNDRQEVMYSPVDHFANEMDEFCVAIMNDKAPLTGGEDGLRDIKIMMAAFESAKTGNGVKLT